MPLGRISDNLAQVMARIDRATIEAGMPPGSVTLVGVTKNRTVEEIEEAIAAGLTAIGENRLQEAQEKLPRLSRPVGRHFIGHLQRNKAPEVLELFELIQSVDSGRLALELDRRAAQLGRTARLLIEVNTSGEPSKFGITPELAGDLVDTVAGCPHLQLLGLMTIGPLTGDRDRISAAFRSLRRLFVRFSSLDYPNCRMELLSMGMSSDFELAIHEGSNLVRVGTAIFGERPY